MTMMMNRARVVLWRRGRRALNSAAAAATGPMAAEARPKAVVLTGPTAVGKTDLSIRLARILNAEIVSADSVQVYKGMDIGSDKVSPEHRQAVKHHLIDTCDIYDTYSSGDFFQHAMDLCQDIASRGKTPLIVGGTWFYLNFLLNGRPAAPRADVVLEDQILREYDGGSDWDRAHADLHAVDPESAARIDRNDWYRLTRAMSVYRMSGRPFSSYKHEVSRTSRECLEPGLSSAFDVTRLYLTAPRWLLFERINQRCEHIVDRGIMEETLRLVEEGLEGQMHAAKSIGYRQCFEFLHSFWLKPSTKTKLMRRKGFYRFLLNYMAATRRLCAKQMRSFRADPSYAWIVRDETTSEDQLVEQIMGLINKEVEAEALGAWDRKLNADNLSLLKGHLPTLEVYDDVERVDETMLALEEAVVATGRAMGWRVEHLEAAQVPEPKRLRAEKATHTRGDRRKNRWLTRVRLDPKMAKKKAARIEELKYE
ncbi:tRNA delta(2)-isopentenylpyrophosphate transferase [Salpingoeca rosetta]|uniref:tRNA dimethylallyltransferase n=1 Tax=Salpingoeca rosetta (strain ATCC 50818 / BSB-021) TaxID=946362 RepID=F2U655_SALR5|nr:tRNA delta(2)-isopentenylpyrophosphate transferase [Salpingoeca rosetta]EGD82996.1 tRNA delta(2)-isopentenylpyrophosphate transferase [Salpingoeca rosetta]|eukprot:XP_004995360.1 tRNA delta(2)-isopentenylpyrophosphate transferase [Salpingoeca rosetta]